jgi:two-component system phosphate regulon sensor histidine kinase PhoR
MADRPATPQPTRNRFTSLNFKVGTLAIGVLAVVLTMFSAVFAVSERQKASEDIVQNGKTFAIFSAKQMYDDYVRFYTHPATSDFENFKDSIGDVLAYNRDVKQVSMLAQNGRILFDSAEFTTGKYSGPARIVEEAALMEAIRSDTTVTRAVQQNGEKLTEIVVPIAENSGGHVVSMRYMLSYESLNGRMLDIYRRIIAVDVLAMLFVAAVVLLFTNRLTRPIIRLTAVAEQIGGGNFAARASHTANDELGRLSAALNAMAARLEDSYRGLEAKVSERTHELETAQIKLRANVQRDEALLASMGDGVIATDRDGTLVLINKAAEELMKISRQDALGKKYHDLWTMEDEKGVAVPDEERPLQRALTSGQQLKDNSHYLVRKDQTGDTIVRFPVSLGVAPVILNNETIGTISVFSDITHEKQVDRMKTEFISLASHQLRTPLSAIRWFTEMLITGDAGKLEPEQQEFVGNINESTLRMIALVNSLLNISRIESGRIIVDPKPTDLQKLVHGVVNDLKAKTEAKQQTLIVNVHQDLPEIKLDPRLIGQVYLNFLTNAIKYTPKGGEISVFISRKGDELISQVTDTGMGIPKSEQDHVFQKFFRAANAVKVETDGTGLGLYLVKAIIESSGGKVWFESIEGKGTTFWFSLPMSGMVAREGEVTLELSEK